MWYEVPAYYKGDPDTVSGPDDVIEWPSTARSSTSSSSSRWSSGRRGKNIAKADAKRHIAGYTIWNDWSARDQQMKEGPLGMGPSKGKDFDTGNSIGPYLVTADELDVSNLRMTAKINGETWTDSPQQRPPVFVRGPDRPRLTWCALVDARYRVLSFFLPEGGGGHDKKKPRLSTGAAR